MIGAVRSSPPRTTARRGSAEQVPPERPGGPRPAPTAVPPWDPRGPERSRAGPTVPGGPMLRRTKSLLGAAALALGSTTALALTISGNASAAPALSAQWYAAAPYLMPEDNSPPDVGAVMDAT